MIEHTHLHMDEKQNDMDNKNLVDLIKDAPQVLSMVYQDLAQPGVRKVGQALETVLEFSTSFLLPVKLLNEKFKLNFTKRLDEYKRKIEIIPDDELCDVNPQIGTPIIEKLSYTTNDEIADLFTTLLAKASSVETINHAHPSFIQMIERMSVDEARIIKYLKNNSQILYASFRANLTNEKGFITILEKGTLLSERVNLLFPNNLKAYLDNLEGMGIVDSTHGQYKADENLYKPLLDTYDFENVQKRHIEGGKYKSIDIIKGYYNLTDFGKLFINSCVE